MVKRVAFESALNRREVAIPQLAMHVGEPQMTVVKKRHNDDSEILKKKKIIMGKIPSRERLNESAIHRPRQCRAKRGPE